MTNSSITELLEQLDRLAGYVRHQGEAAKDGVAPSADHLIYLAEHIRLAGQQLATTIQEHAVQEQERQTVFAASIAGRNAAVIRRMHRIAHYISQLRFDDVYNFDTNGRVHVSTSDRNKAMALIEWFYLVPGPKKVIAYINNHDDKAYIRVVSRQHQIDEIEAWTGFDSPEACAMVAACHQPSIHLLRRLQIAGAQ